MRPIIHLTVPCSNPAWQVSVIECEEAKFGILKHKVSWNGTITQMQWYVISFNSPYTLETAKQHAVTESKHR